jgi:hypothetical protein
MLCVNYELPFIDSLWIPLSPRLHFSNNSAAVREQRTKRSGSLALRGVAA